MITSVTNQNYKNNVVAFKSKNPVIQDAISTSRILSANGYGRPNEKEYYDFIMSEIDELKMARINQDYENMHEEIGDVLFDTIMLADYYGINPSKALADTNKKINGRVQLAQVLADKPLVEYPLETRLEYWNQAKKILKENLV